METIRIIDPRVNIKEDVEKNHMVFYGGLRTTDQVNTADSWGSVGTTPVQALWTLNPPSTTTIVDREIRVRCYFEITVDAPLELGTNDALRQFPIHSLCDVLTVQINGESVSDNVADKLHAMMCYGNNAIDRTNKNTMSPLMPDAYQRYSDWSLYGSSKCPLKNYGESSVEDPRGGFPVEMISPTKFRVVLTESMLISPFLSGFGSLEEGFVNVNQMNISYRWKSNLSQILSHSSLGGAITVVSATMYQPPELLTRYITPDLTQQIPAKQILPYHKTQDYIKTMSPLAIDATTLVISDSIKLSQIPKRLYLFCRHSRNTSNQNTSDSFLAIERLNILWNNQSGLFSSSSQQTLYEMSKNNGCNLSWSQWSKYRGSVLCISFGSDIGLLDSEAPSCQGQWTIQVQMNVKNTSGAIFDPEFYMIFMNEGTFSIAENFARASLGNLTNEIVLASLQAPEVDYNEVANLQGGNFFTGFKSFINKVARGIQKGADVASKFAPIIAGAIPELAPIAGALPMVGRLAGSVREATGGRMVGGRMVGGGQMRMNSGGLSGGSMRRNRGY
jgi:hypothetical protein